MVFGGGGGKKWLSVKRGTFIGGNETAEKMSSSGTALLGESESAREAEKKGKTGGELLGMDHQKNPSCSIPRRSVVLKFGQDKLE